jgi:hypothetical protein
MALTYVRYWIVHIQSHWHLPPATKVTATFEIPDLAKQALSSLSTTKSVDNTGDSSSQSAAEAASIPRTVAAASESDHPPKDSCKEHIDSRRGRHT